MTTTLNKKNPKNMPNNVVVHECRINHGEETLIADERDSLGSVEMVQRRLNELHGKGPGMRGRVVSSKSGRRPERSA